jgi:ribosome-binding factor A
MARNDKVSEALRREIGSIIQYELKDPRLGFVTVTRVELTHDLRYAKIFFSVLGKEEERAKTKAALDSALGFIRCLIAERIRLRFVPELSFHEDRSIEYSIQIQEALDKVKELEKPQLPPVEVKAVKLKKERRSVPKKSSRVRKKK